MLYFVLGLVVGMIVMKVCFSRRDAFPEIEPHKLQTFEEFLNERIEEEVGAGGDAAIYKQTLKMLMLDD